MKKYFILLRNIQKLTPEQLDPAGQGMHSDPPLGT